MPLSFLTVDRVVCCNPNPHPLKRSLGLFSCLTIARDLHSQNPAEFTVCTKKSFEKSLYTGKIRLIILLFNKMKSPLRLPVNVFELFMVWTAL